MNINPAAVPTSKPITGTLHKRGCIHPAPLRNENLPRKKGIKAKSQIGTRATSRCRHSFNGKNGKEERTDSQILIFPIGNFKKGTV